MGVCVGTFVAQNGNSTPTSVACLKKVSSNLSCMPNLNQIQAIFQAYSPRIYFHPDEEYLSSSVSWFFNNGALLYKKGEESNPVPVEPTGSNLLQGGSNDGEYWLDLPVDKKPKRESRKEIYKKLRIGEHVGDWEHLTLRISNFNGELWSVYFSQHSGGSWFNASELEFENGNKAVCYASLHGHAMYSKPGLVLQGSSRIGIRNDTSKSKIVLDTGARFSVVAAEYLGTAIIEPPWLNYLRKWGPTVSYDVSVFQKFVKSLPNEVFGEEGPTGPKLKRNWIGDEV
ncbi:hypothetical protein GH714_014799 [Hevea brasiliensis]|uniref:Uncharacterized protein n=1 Tax=Hevea brasiliensis TaxID=3981 RepID=A0A6A6N4B7_HEVBR|nr:hypothetical protein GH714_014799 [Hevea brasiliensis]